jgi:uncharacterized protein (DUF885 family)
MTAELHADPIFALSSGFVDDFAARSPVQATLTGIPGQHDGWDDYSPAGAEKMRAFLGEYRAKLDALPAANDRYGRIARRVMREFLDERIAYLDHADHLADLNNIESPFQHLRTVFDLMDTKSAAGFAAIARRLETLHAPLSGYLEALRTGQARGLSAAKRQVRAVVEQAAVHAGEGSSLGDLVGAFDRANIDDPALRERLVAAVAHARGAFGRFGEALAREYLPNASDRDPVGSERYARSAARFLGMDLDPHETYAWGWREIAAIEAAMARLAEGVRPGASIAEVVRQLEKHPDEVVEDNERFLVLMRERQGRALRDLMESHFDVPEPIRNIEVKLAPPGGALGAYYIPPSEDFSRPGTVYYAPASDKKYALFSEITTAYHEGFPGHHLQCGLQVYYADRLSRLHRLLVCCSGYAEGWALYAEQLMDELGYYERPSYVLGMLMAKLFRACRIVADIGMHLELRIPETSSFHPGEVWSHDLCVEFLVERAFIDRGFAESEAVRYLGWPGQAISYKVGERVILELRDEMRRELGEAFDLRAFHEAVLGAGSVGLSHLGEIVRETLLAG